MEIEVDIVEDVVEVIKVELAETKVVVREEAKVVVPFKNPVFLSILSLASYSILSYILNSNSYL